MGLWSGFGTFLLARSPIVVNLLMFTVYFYFIVLLCWESCDSQHHQQLHKNTMMMRLQSPMIHSDSETEGYVGVCPYKWYHRCVRRRWCEIANICCWFNWFSISWSMLKWIPIRIQRVPFEHAATYEPSSPTHHWLWLRLHYRHRGGCQRKKTRRGRHQTDTNDHRVSAVFLKAWSWWCLLSHSWCSCFLRLTLCLEVDLERVLISSFNSCYPRSYLVMTYSFCI